MGLAVRLEEAQRSHDQAPEVSVKYDYDRPVTMET